MTDLICGKYREEELTLIDKKLKVWLRRLDLVDLLLLDDACRIEVARRESQ